MDRKELAKEIADFCIKYRLLGKPKNIILAKDRIEKELENICFVESLIHMIILKTQYIKDVDTKRLKNLLMELEMVRLDLEYDNVNIEVL